MSWIVKMILLDLASALSAVATAKRQYFVHFSFNSTLQLINCISSDFQKLLKYCNDTAFVVFFRIPSLLCCAGWATVSLTNLALYL